MKKIKWPKKAIEFDKANRLAIDKLSAKVLRKGIKQNKNIKI